jgi:hypothetical protein
MTSKQPRKKYKFGWADAVIAVSLIGLAAVAGTVYLGTVEKPAQDLRNEKAACENFNRALENAYKTENITDFYYTLFRGAYKGIDESIEGKELNDNFIALAQLEAYVSKESAEGMLETVGAATSMVQATCAQLLDVQFSTPAPTN